jgi:S-adenosylmethionine:tRNA ribosyltransferase-isomerase
VVVLGALGASRELNTSDFDFELPPECIAQEPIEPRDHARLFVHWMGADRSAHLQVRDLPELLQAGDLCVFNNTRVLPARLLGRRASGGQAELLLIEARAELGSRVWRAMARPAARFHPGERVPFEAGQISVRMLQRVVQADGSLGPCWDVEFESATPIEQLLEAHGRMPLPPYIARPQQAQDRERYQTVYAREAGAVAAPTAGLHFTPALLAALEARGIERTELTLHVGLGTFLPVQVEQVDQHRMHSERFALSASTAQAIRTTRQRGGRVIAIGTTSVRVLETCVDAAGAVEARSGSTDIFLYPGRRLRATDALLTNFHLPKSTLLMLVSAMAGRERVLRLYREAIAEGYRFYSYGDALLLLP